MVVLFPEHLTHTLGHSLFSPITLFLASKEPLFNEMMDTLPVWITHLVYAMPGQQVVLTVQFSVPGAYAQLPENE